MKVWYIWAVEYQAAGKDLKNHMIHCNLKKSEWNYHVKLTKPGGET